MNILFVLASLAHAAGVERVMSEKMNYLAEQGHRVVFVTYEQRNNPLIFPLHPDIRYVDLDCPYYTLYRHTLLYRLLKAVSMKRKFTKKLQALIDKFSIDVLVTPTNAAMFMGEMMAAKHVNKIVESHGVFSKTMKSDSFIANVGKKLQLRAIKKCDLLVSLTNNDAQCWKKFVQKTEVHPNPVSFYVENTDGLEKQEGRILAIGGLNKEKRFDRLIDSFALISDKFPQWHIDIFGEGHLKETLIKQIKTVGLENRIIINSPTNHIDIEYQKSQIFVLSSDTEGFSLVLIEAMASGLPCLATNCPFGPANIIEDGVTGLLANLDIKDLASKLEWMITHEEERKEMGENAHKVAARYKKEIVMKEWEKTYMSVINS